MHRIAQIQRREDRLRPLAMRLAVLLFKLLTRRKPGSNMISSVSMSNFKCFKAIEVPRCARINVIVGDNGAGKTALLEGMFLALSGNPLLPLRFRTTRGWDGHSQGTPRQIEDALFGDLFFGFNSKSTIEVSLRGTGPSARSVRISRGASSSFQPVNTIAGTVIFNAELDTAAPSPSLRFEWTDSAGGKHTLVARVQKDGVSFEGDAEELPDFSYFSTNMPGGSTENAQRLSEISRANRREEFVRVFASQYPWIKDLSIEVLAGSPAIFATIEGSTEKVPMPSVSGAINRYVGVLLAIARTRSSVVLVDEIDDGVYYARHEQYIRTLVQFARDFDAQLFLTTHDDEWLRAFARAVGERSDDVALWRVERSENSHVVKVFSGGRAIAGIQTGEVR